MRRPVRATRSILVVAAAVVALLVPVGVARVVAAPSTLDGLSATGRIAATPYSFWFGQVNRDGICRMLSGCVSARGTDPNWVFQVAVDVPAVGVQTLDLDARVTEQVAVDRIRLTLSMDSALASLHGDVLLTVRPSGKDTLVTVALPTMAATGLAAAAIPQFQERLQPDLQAQLDVLGNERVSAGTKVRLVVTPSRKASARVTVTAPSMTRKAPIATGLLRILVGTRVVCTAPVRSSVGRCTFTPPRRGTEIRAVVTGRLSNGFPVWNSATVRYGR